MFRSIRPVGGAGGMASPTGRALSLSRAPACGIAVPFAASRAGAQWVTRGEGLSADRTHARQSPLLITATKRVLALSSICSTHPHAPSTRTSSADLLDAGSAQALGQRARTTPRQPLGRVPRTLHLGRGIAALGEDAMDDAQRQPLVPAILELGQLAVLQQQARRGDLQVALAPRGDPECRPAPQSEESTTGRCRRAARRAPSPPWRRRCRRRATA